jgi:hypothetical protein
MVYTTECLGSATIDRQQTSYAGSQLGAYINEAYGQRFVPTSKCLDSINLRIKRNRDIDLVVEIRSDSGGNPAGNIGSGYLGQYRIPYTSVPTTFTVVNFPFGIILPDLNPKWIVIVSAVYDPNYNESVNYFEITGDMISDTIEYSAYKSGNNAWVLAKNRKFYFQTYKKTYTPPCEPPVSNILLE